MRVLLWAALGGLLVRLMAVQRVVDLDAFHEMALFREALARGALPLHDPFSYTPTVATMVHHEWGAGAVFYGVWAGLALGPLGLGLLRIALVAGVAALGYRAARTAGATHPAIALTAPLSLFLFGCGLAPVRAHLFTYLFTAILLALLVRDRAGARVWIAPWLVGWVLWVNLHGGFVVGLAMILAEAAQRAWVASRSAGVAAGFRAARHLALLALAMAALTLVNPYGAAYHRYLAHALTMPRPLIAEWAPLWDARADSTLVLLFLAAVLVLGYVAARRGVARMPGLAIAALFAVAALRSQRHLSLFALGWFAAVAPALAATGVGASVQAFWARRRAVVAAALLPFAGVGLWSLAATPPWALLVPNDTRYGRLAYPVAAVEWLAARGFAGNLLTTFENGSYVMWKLFPAVKVSLDSRYEAAYQDGVLEAHRAFFEAEPGWEAFLARYPSDATLLPCSYPVVRRLDGLPGWTRVFDDGSFCIDVRETGAAPVRAAAAGP